MNEAPSSGYSGTPLARKLSLKDGMHVWFDGVPETVLAELESVQIDLLDAPEHVFDAAHIFVTSRKDLERKLAHLRVLVPPHGFLWVSWPKKASKVPTDITEDAIREVALPLGLVDVKVCAVDATWSGLKLVIRKERR